MKRLFHRYKYDFLSIVREPIMIVFAILPLFIIILFRLGLSPLSDFLENKIEFVLIDFKIYFIVFTFVMTPYMTGVLAGFLMLDERDGNIFELLLTTPSGFSGYLISRLFIPITLTTIYSAVCYLAFITDISSPVTFIGIMIFSIIQSWIIALLLFSIARNKVQGLTIAKGLGLLFIPVFFDLMNNEFLNAMAYISPFYWSYEYVRTENPSSFVLGITVNSIWLFGVVLLGYRRTYRIKSFSS